MIRDLCLCGIFTSAQAYVNVCARVCIFVLQYFHWCGNNIWMKSTNSMWTLIIRIVNLWWISMSVTLFFDLTIFGGHLATWTVLFITGAFHFLSGHKQLPIEEHRWKWSTCTQSVFFRGIWVRQIVTISHVRTGIFFFLPMWNAKLSLRCRVRKTKKWRKSCTICIFAIIIVFPININLMNNNNRLYIWN